MLKNLISKLVNRTKNTVTFPAVRTSSGEFLLKKTDFGLVRVEYAVIQKIAARALAEVNGLNDAQVAVEKSASNVTPIKIQLTTTLAEGFSAPKIAQLADKAINDAFKQVLQLDFYVPVDVKVKQIMQPVTQRRRVR